MTAPPISNRSVLARNVARGSLTLPGILHHPRALAQHDPRCRPALRRCRVGRLRDLEIIDARDVFDDLAADLSQMSMRNVKCVLVFIAPPVA